MYPEPSGAICKDAIDHSELTIANVSAHHVSVPDLVAQQATVRPQHIALADALTTVTYGAMEQRANRLARYLSSLGVGPEVRVALCMLRSSLNVIAALAVLKTGGAYVPLDPTYPRDRLSFILSDASAPIVLTDETSASRVPTGPWQPMVVSAETEYTADDRLLATPTGPDNLAYVIYTSGSTGTPKGVEITHRGLLNLVYWHRKAFGICPEDRATQFASFGFDAAVWEVWPHLTAGATLYMAPEAARTSAELLRDWLVEQQITITFAPTAVAEQLMVLTWPGETKLRYLLTGADILHHYPLPGLPFEVINNYGPTEATVVATSGRVLPQSSGIGRPSIGRPIENTKVYILDEHLTPVAPLQIGEIYIGGPGVARGYVNSPELTAERFVPDPFTEQGNNARLYRTGDLAYSLPNGEIAFCGRADGLIKIRGYRIEPNEIVSVLNTHPSVQVSTVVARGNNEDNVRLVAYVVSGPEPPTAAELRLLLHQKLPSYMIPQEFVRLKALPLTTNGKVDVISLPVPDDSNTLSSDEPVAADDTLVIRVAAVIANLLGVPRVGTGDNFFVLGGHSLLGTQLIARVRDTFGVQLPLRSIFDRPTPAQLADEIEQLLVAKVKSMSNEEAAHMLGQYGVPGAHP